MGAAPGSAACASQCTRAMVEWAEAARSVTDSIFDGVGHVGGMASSVSYDSPDREARISLTAVGEGIMREKRALTSSDSAENLLEAVPKPPDWDRMSKEEQRVWRNHAKTAKARAVKAEKRSSGTSSRSRGSLKVEPRPARDGLSPPCLAAAKLEARDYLL